MTESYVQDLQNLVKTKYKNYRDLARAMDIPYPIVLRRMHGSVKVEHDFIMKLITLFGRDETLDVVFKK